MDNNDKIGNPASFFASIEDPKSLDIISSW